MHDWSTPCDDGFYMITSRKYPTWRKVRNWLIKRAWKYLRVDMSWIKERQRKHPLSKLQLFIVDESTPWNGEIAEGVFKRIGEKEIENDT
jgi:hypothetical protein